MTKTEVTTIMKRLEAHADPVNVAGMARFGIVAGNVFGIAMPTLKEIAKEVKKQTSDRHSLALELWETGNYEARIIAYLIDDPKLVTADQMENWVADFDNWATCDGACGHLFCKTAHAYDKAYIWSEREEEFIKRAGICLMAWLAVHDKKAHDDKIAAFLPILEAKAGDERNFIKKAVNWSLRQIGKRSLDLNELAVETAERIRDQGSKPARWIAADALRELKSDAVIERLKAKEAKKAADQ